MFPFLGKDSGTPQCPVQSLCQIGARDEDQAPPLSTLKACSGIGSQPLIKASSMALYQCFKGVSSGSPPICLSELPPVVIYSSFVSGKHGNFCFLCLPPLWTVLADSSVALISNAPHHFLFQQCPQVPGIPTAVNRAGFSQKLISPRLPYHGHQTFSITTVSESIKKVQTTQVPTLSPSDAIVSGNSKLRIWGKEREFLGHPSACARKRGVFWQGTLLPKFI